MTMYTATFSLVADTTTADLFEIVAPSSPGITILHRMVLGQSSDFGDAQEEIRDIKIKRGQTTTGSGGSTVTPVDIGLTGATFGGTVKANNTTAASGGTIQTLHSEPWNVRGPFDWCPTPEGRIWLGSGVRATIELSEAPADSITVSGTLLFEAP